MSRRAVYTAPDPGAASISYTAPAGPERRIVRGIQCFFATDATVGDRQLFIQITSKEGTLVTVASASRVQAASISGYYIWAAGMSNGVLDSPVNSCLAPELELVDGDVVTIADKYAISAGDRLTSFTILAEQWDD